jgi:hypothetical protein
LSKAARRYLVLLSTVGVLGVAPPTAGAVVLHDQLGGASDSIYTSSQNFEASLNDFDDLAADDFVVPPGMVWGVSQIEVLGQRSGTSEAATANVFLFADGGTIPGAQIFSHANLARGSGQTYPNLDLPISDFPALGPGRYWIGIQANRDFNPGGNNWWWKDRAPQVDQPAAFRQPGDGFGDGCTTFAPRVTGGCYPSTAGFPDQAFRLSGTQSGLDLLSARAKSAKKVKLTVDAPGAGALTVTGSKLKSKQVQITAPGQITIGIKTKPGARHKLADGKRVKSTIELSLALPLGQALTDEDQRKLRLKRRG